jgi:hypothetical protein
MTSRAPCSSTLDACGRRRHVTDYVASTAKALAAATSALDRSTFRLPTTLFDPDAGWLADQPSRRKRCTTSGGGCSTGASGVHDTVLKTIFRMFFVAGWSALGGGTASRTAYDSSWCTLGGARLEGVRKPVRRLGSPDANARTCSRCLMSSTSTRSRPPGHEGSACAVGWRKA